MKRLRAEIEPVAARDFMRFLLRWQRVADDARMEGPDAVEVIVAQLEGFEAPAVAWESEILPARLAEDEPTGSTIAAGRTDRVDAARPAHRTSERRGSAAGADPCDADHATGAA